MLQIRLTILWAGLIIKQNIISTSPVLCVCECVMLLLTFFPLQRFILIAFLGFVILNIVVSGLYIIKYCILSIDHIKGIYVVSSPCREPVVM